MAKKNTYQISSPLWFKGERVWFLLHNGAKRWGYVNSVETHYDHTHRAYHVYAMRQTDKKRHVYVGEDHILARTN